MSNDILKSVSQGSNGAYDEEIEESEKSPMSSKDFADYMRRNLEMGKAMEAASKYSNTEWVREPFPDPIRLY